MPVFKYRDPQTGEWINVAGGGGGSAEIPVTSEPGDNVNVWIDPNEEGNDEGFYTRSQTLSSETKAAFGLGVDAVPDEAFLALMNASNNSGVGIDDYVWEQYQTQKVIGNNEFVTLVVNASDGRSGTVYYSNECIVDIQNRTVSIPSNSPSITMNSSNYTNYVDTLKGKYIMISNTTSGVVYKVDDNIKYIHYLSNSTGKYQIQIEAGRVTVEDVLVDYVSDSNSSAYPPTEDDGYTYKSLGRIYGLLTSSAKIAIGSYTGTGTYGASKPNSLTFDFTPVMVFVHDTGVSIGNGNTFVALANASMGTGENSNNNRLYTLNNKTLSWYNTVNATCQLNNSGTTYYYIAIG